MPITIIDQDITFTSFEFYNVFLRNIALFYKNNIDKEISFSLINENDEDIAYHKYRIDGNTIPLLLNILEQLSSYQRKGVVMWLQNVIGHDKNLGTSDAISFLVNSNFFNIAQRLDASYSKLSPPFPIIDLKGSTKIPSKKSNSNFEVDCFSFSKEEGLRIELEGLSEEEQRDRLIEHYKFKVEERFSKIFPESKTNRSFLENTTSIVDYKKFYVHVLPELITNGVLHSGANTFASLFTNKFTTKISVSDNGIGFAQSLNKKGNLRYYIKNCLSKELSKKNTYNIDPSYLRNLFSVFEALYFSMLKNRLGLFDLICNVVLMLDGTFRVHTENTQLILSKKINEAITELYKKRKEIIKLHDEKLLKKIGEDDFNSQMETLSSQALELFINFYEKILEKYNRDVKFSSIRFFPVKFKGVHIEVEIPN